MARGRRRSVDHRSCLVEKAIFISARFQQRGCGRLIKARGCFECRPGAGQWPALDTVEEKHYITPTGCGRLLQAPAVFLGMEAMESNRALFTGLPLSSDGRKLAKWLPRFFKVERLQQKSQIDKKPLPKTEAGHVIPFRDLVASDELISFG